MTEGRIRGSEVEIRITRAGRIVSSISAIRSFELSLKVEPQEDEYLGEKTTRYDATYKGVGGSFEFVPENGDTFDFFEYVRKRAQRDPTVAEDAVNMTVRLSFPEGAQRVVIPDAVFSGPSLSVGGRSSYVSKKISFSAAGYQPI